PRRTKSAGTPTNSRSNESLAELTAWRSSARKAIGAAVLGCSGAISVLGSCGDHGSIVARLGRGRLHVFVAHARGGLADDGPHLIKQIAIERLPIAHAWLNALLHQCLAITASQIVLLVVICEHIRAPGLTEELENASQQPFGVLHEVFVTHSAAAIWMLCLEFDHFGDVIRPESAVGDSLVGFGFDVTPNQRVPIDRKMIRHR